MTFMFEVGKAACTRTLSKFHTDSLRRRESELFVSRMEAIEQIKLKRCQRTFQGIVHHGNLITALKLPIFTVPSITLPPESWTSTPCTLRTLPAPGSAPLGP